MTNRRQEILDAALPIFVEKGFISTTIADIRKASGATTGSIYHFFAGKPGIAIALWREANATWSERTEAARRAHTPEEMIKSSVRGLLEWATSNRALFLFFEELRIRAYSDPDLAPIIEDIDRTHEVAAELYKGWVKQGQVEDIAWPVASALMMGPAYDYLRKCQDIDDHHDAIETIVQNAWMSVSRDCRKSNRRNRSQ